MRRVPTPRVLATLLACAGLGVSASPVAAKSTAVNWRGTLDV